MNYNQLKKLDEETLEKLTEGSGPVDKCLCSLLSPPDVEKRGLRASIKKAFNALGSGKKKKQPVYGQNSVDIPLTFSKGGNGIYTTKEVIKRKSSCGKCGCDSDDIILKHSYANIKITAPDIDMSSICSCDSNCLPGFKEKLTNSIKVTVEQTCVDLEPTSISTISEYSVSEASKEMASEPLSRSDDSRSQESQESQRRPEQRKEEGKGERPVEELQR